MNTHTRPQQTGPLLFGSTALGSLLQFGGTACSSFPGMTAGRSQLLNASLNLAPLWLAFFQQLDISPEPVEELAVALHRLATQKAAREAALAAYHSLFPLAAGCNLLREAEPPARARPLLPPIRRPDATRERPLWQPGKSALGHELSFAGRLFDAAFITSGSFSVDQEESSRQAFATFVEGRLLRSGPQHLRELRESTDNPFWRSLFTSLLTVIESLHVSLVLVTD